MQVAQTSLLCERCAALVLEFTVQQEKRSGAYHFGGVGGDDAFGDAENPMSARDVLQVVFHHRYFTTSPKAPCPSDDDATSQSDGDDNQL